MEHSWQRGDRRSCITIKKIFCRLKHIHLTVSIHTAVLQEQHLLVRNRNICHFLMMLKSQRKQNLGASFDHLLLLRAVHSEAVRFSDQLC